MCLQMLPPFYSIASLSFSPCPATRFSLPQHCNNHSDKDFRWTRGHKTVNKLSFYDFLVGLYKDYAAIVITLNLTNQHSCLLFLTDYMVVSVLLKEYVLGANKTPACTLSVECVDNQTEHSNDSDTPPLSSALFVLARE